MKTMLAALVLGAAVASGAAVAESADDPGMAPARQAYRDSCARFESRDYCECLGSGLSHTLTVQEMGVARHLMVNQMAPRRASPLRGYDAATVQDMTQRISALQARLDGVCAQFRRGGAPMTPIPTPEAPESPIT